jgi:phage anti-repressor protein
MRDLFILKGSKQLVDARELHCLLKSKMKFEDWIILRIEDCNLEENQDYYVNGEEYELEIEPAKVISKADVWDGDKVSEDFINRL